MAQILSIGELIQCHRYNRGMTLAQLSELTGIHKGTISKIENGDVKRPEYKTIRPLADTLQIPLETLVELHITVDKRADTLLFVLQDVIQHSGTAELVTKVGRKFLESPSDDSHALVERLYDFVGHVENKEIQFALYQLIVDYSRDHGIMPFLARGLFQVYLIERDDFTRLRSVYESGKHIVQYVDFLNSEDRITLYYKLAIHAFNLFLYEQSINLCLNVLQEAGEAGREHLYYVNALGILCNSYFYLGDYQRSENFLSLYMQYEYPDVKANAVLMSALINAKKGNSNFAITELRTFLETCSQDAALQAINQLMPLYLQENRLVEARQLIDYPICMESISTNNPNTISQLAEYYYHRAAYFVTLGELNKGVSEYLEGAFHFSRVNDTVQEKECIKQIMCIHLQQNVTMSMSTVEKLKAYYERSAAKENKLEGLV
ncbi:MAG: helix-turn-helix transcriptional regulator [Paenibacillus dendritiformis]|uniref:helix-turn-helix transcriptional regulator n=1 Tax=uncultured Paenibacillus sp. TaxID=227322 RepID=UPI0025E35D86|nr:helix-turn-helix transcriptional regulator [uncultured Paenibacillus sp.]MDU5145770.1 helix-turn-helix transcriptional regulator [Paenibacillus dendritiformis]